MKHNIISLLEDNGIHLTTEGANCAPGWQNCRCPFCEDTSDHLGYNVESDYFSCWKCGFHPIKNVVSELLNLTNQETYDLLARYKKRPSMWLEERMITRTTRIQLPHGTKELSHRHRLYLQQRQFDPDILADRYGLLGTEHLGDYKFRIIAPIFQNGRLVSYIGRDITNRSDLRYKACPSEKEVVSHKHCLYGIDIVQNDFVVIVEGVSDAWRLGPGAVALFGLLYSSEQIKLLKRFKRRYIMLDSGENEFKRSKELAAMLSIFNGENIVVELGEDDPGDMKQEEADILMKDLGFKI